MNLNNLFENELNGISTDFKAEVIAAELIENNKPADRVLIVPLGGMNRPQNKDIQSVLTEVSGYDNKEYSIIKTHKEGLYDKLPEGLFHTPISYAVDKTEQQVIESIKRHRVEEKAARIFFLPFDTALFSSRVQITLYENQLDKKFHNNQLINIFSPHWEIFQYLDVVQANIFLQYLPTFHRIRDDWDRIETLLELMFQVPAVLKIRLQKEVSIGDFSQPGFTTLGNGTLGIDLTTGSIADSGEFMEMVVTFGPLSSKQLERFTGKEQQEKVVLMLCDYVLPADLEVVVEYDFEITERQFSLQEDGMVGGNSEMGVSTYL